MAAAGQRRQRGRRLPGRAGLGKGPRSPPPRASAPGGYASAPFLPACPLCARAPPHGGPFEPHLKRFGGSVLSQNYPPAAPFRRRQRHLGPSRPPCPTPPLFPLLPSTPPPPRGLTPLAAAASNSAAAHDESITLPSSHPIPTVSNPAALFFFLLCALLMRVQMLPLLSQPPLLMLPPLSTSLPLPLSTISRLRSFCSPPTFFSFSSTHGSGCRGQGGAPPPRATRLFTQNYSRRSSPPPNTTQSERRGRRAACFARAGPAPHPFHRHLPSLMFCSYPKHGGLSPPV